MLAKEKQYANEKLDVFIFYDFLLAGIPFTVIQAESERRKSICSISSLTDE
jgi:hypothetical protein